MVLQLQGQGFYKRIIELQLYLLYCCGFPRVIILSTSFLGAYSLHQKGNRQTKMASRNNELQETLFREPGMTLIQ